MVMILFEITRPLHTHSESTPVPPTGNVPTNVATELRWHTAASPHQSGTLAELKRFEWGVQRV